MDKITHAAQIVRLLKKIHGQRALLSISVTGATKPYNSAILEVNPDAGYLIIDELSPKEGHDLLLKARKLDARLQLDGIRIRFFTTLEASGSDAGIAFYKLAIPQEINYFQRRSHHRVRPSLITPISINITHADETSATGEIYNISASGLSVKLKDDQLATPLKVTDILMCLFTLPSNDKITCKLEVRSIHATDQQNFIRIGARFIGLASTLQRPIQRYIVSLEREQLKKTPRNG